MQYYLGLQNESKGPFAEERVRAMLAQGEASSETLAWHEGMEDWKPLGEVLPAAAGAARFSPPMAQAADLSEDRASSRWKLASREIRLGAAMIDMAVAFLLYLPLLAGMMVTGKEKVEELPMAILAFTGLGFLALAGVQIYLLCTRAQTIGKCICGIRIYNRDTRLQADWVKTLVLRGFVNGLLSAIPCAGSIYALVDICFIFRDDRRCIHDLLAGTVVGTLPKGGAPTVD